MKYEITRTERVERRIKVVELRLGQFSVGCLNSQYGRGHVAHFREHTKKGNWVPLRITSPEHKSMKKIEAYAERKLKVCTENR